MSETHRLRRRHGVINSTAQELYLYHLKILRVKECKVSVGDFEIFPVHSFADTDACADDRLGVELRQGFKLMH